MAAAPETAFRSTAKGIAMKNSSASSFPRPQLRLADDLGGGKPAVRHRLAASRGPSPGPRGALHRWAVCLRQERTPTGPRRDHRGQRQSSSDLLVRATGSQRVRQAPVVHHAHRSEVCTHCPIQSGTGYSKQYHLGAHLGSWNPYNLSNF